MQHDNDEFYHYEPKTKREETLLTIDDDDFKPIGFGRKSPYAVQTKKPDNRIRSVQVDPEEEHPAYTKRKTSAERGRMVAAEPWYDSGEEYDGYDEEVREDGIVIDRPGTSSARRKTAAFGGLFGQLRREKSTPKRNSVKTPVDDSGYETKLYAKSKKKPAKKRSLGEDFLSLAGLTAMAVGGACKKLFGSKRNIAVAAGVVALFLVVWGISSAITMYRSNTALADKGQDVDENNIIVRKVTDLQNQKKVTYFLIAGVDKSSKLTDCIWVMCLDNQEHKIDVLQIPRDTYVGEDSIYPHKINAVYESPKEVNWCEECGREVPEDEFDASSGRHLNCGMKVTTKKEGSINALIRCVNTRLSLPIDHYVLFDFKGFEGVVDALGGVDIAVEGDQRIYSSKKDYVTLHDGLNHLDGKTALTFMRNRKTFANGDLGRVKAQRQLIHSMMEKVGDMSVVDAFKVLMAAKDHFKTDMSIDEITSFIAPVKKCKTDGLHMFELPGEAKTVRRTSYYICDEEKSAELINEYMLPYSNKITADDIDFPDP